MMQPSESHAQRVDRYELLAELAAGGMATVYLARLGGAGGFQRLYAIKKLHPHLAHEREFVEMFLDEARLAARIHHPNVVPILEVCTNEAGYYLVMEYIEGESMARLIGRCASRSQRIPTRIAAKMVVDALAGLEAAHELTDDFGEPLNIVHRDVSPQNVMVGIDGTSRITDFGVARAATRMTTTRAGQLKGKLGYMAPEQAQGEAIDRRADVFAMGVILWETLTGRRLFRGKGEGGDAETLRRLLYEPIPRMAESMPEVPQVFDDVCAKALDRSIDVRFATCAAFADALEAAASVAGGMASTREVAAFVESVAGPEIAEQREVVRNWATRSQVNVVARTELPTMPGTPSMQSSPFATQSSVLQNTTASAPRSRVLLSAIGGALAAVALIAGGLFVWRASVRSPDPDPVPVEDPVVLAASVSASESLSAASTPEPVASASSPVATGSAVAAVSASASATRTAPTSTRGGRSNGDGPSHTSGDTVDQNPYR